MNYVNLRKHYVTKVIPHHLERPLYVFQSSFLLHNVLKNWAPMKEVLFEIPSDFKNGVLGFYTFGWLFLGWLISHKLFPFKIVENNTIQMIILILIMLHFQPSKMEFTSRVRVFSPISPHCRTLHPLQLDH